MLLHLCFQPFSSKEQTLLLYQIVSSWDFQCFTDFSIVWFIFLVYVFLLSFSLSHFVNLWWYKQYLKGLVLRCVSWGQNSCFDIVCLGIRWQIEVLHMDPMPCVTPTVIGVTNLCCLSWCSFELPSLGAQAGILNTDSSQVAPFLTTCPKKNTFIKKTCLFRV